ncbi:MAG: radical SAM protein [Candidatus Caenarcaniphilales bacterium]|nr:radical SAM protein [Candidatus Caenarcaniphilales bacterium]
MNPITKAVYGPVKSWRFGHSLGIDPVFEISTCSFNCIYCQLGHIQRVTMERKIFVPTAKVLEDFQEFKTKPYDVITFSGSGEPTLALNLAEIAQGLKAQSPQTPLIILTNATLFTDPAVREDLNYFDRVIAKLDAPDDETLQMMNRPAEGISIASIKEGIRMLKKSYQGELDIQMMFMPANLQVVEEFAAFLSEIEPHTIQLNTPLRPYPMIWRRENRGNHIESRDYETRTLRVITPEEAKKLETILRESTGLNVLSVYRE